MDLSLSPDLEAYWCYLILFTIGLIVAAIQVRELLKGFTNSLGHRSRLDSSGGIHGGSCCAVLAA